MYDLQSEVENQFFQLPCIDMQLRLKKAYEFGAQSHDLECDRDRGLGKESWPRTVRKGPIRFGEPVWFNIQRKKNGSLRLGAVQVFVLLPRVDRNGRVITQRKYPSFDDEFLIGTAGLKDQMAMRMRMGDQRGVHIKKSDSPESSAQDAQRLGHRRTPASRCLLQHRTILARMADQRNTDDSAKETSEMIKYPPQCKVAC